MAQDSPNIDFLYDFLYLDRTKAQSWLAQLVADGVPVSTKYSGATGKSKTIQGRAGVPPVFSTEGSTTSSGVETHERNFNAEWSVPLTLLDMLDENGFIQRNPDNAVVGSLIYVIGRVQLIDIGFLKNGWNAISGIILNQGKPTNANKAARALQKDQMNTFGEVLRVMPALPQVYLRTDDDDLFWSVLKQEHAIIDLSALTLTFGANIQGSWHMLAVLDAKPDDHIDTEAPVAPIGGELAQGILQIPGPIRQAVGRGPNAYGASPIAIFRPIPKAT